MKKLFLILLVFVSLFSIIQCDDTSTSDNTIKTNIPIVPDPESPEDNYEENDSVSSGYNFSTHENTWLSSLNGYGYQNDEDWYQLNIPAKYCILTVTCLFSHADGNIDIELRNSFGLKMGSYSLTDNEVLTYNYFGTYGGDSIRVFNANNGTQYDLMWEIEEVDDSYEENESRVTAYDFTYITSIGAGWFYAAQRDDDWYAVNVKSTHLSWQVFLNTNNYLISSSYSNMQICNSSGTVLTTSTLGIGEFKEINYAFPSAGTYYIRVYGSNDGHSYSFAWNEF